MLRHLDLVAHWHEQQRSGQIMKFQELNELKKRFEMPPPLLSDNDLRVRGIDPKFILFMARPDFSDNSHALWEYVRRNTKYRTAWLLWDRGYSARLAEKGIENAVWDTPKGQALVGSARYFINTINVVIAQKKTGQIFVNLWHGSGIKASDFLETRNDNSHLLKTKTTVDSTDLFLVHSFVDKINMAAEFNCDARKFIATGQPRLDKLKTANGKQNMAKLHGGALVGYKNLILYAPTFRMNSFNKVGGFFDSNVFNLPGYDRQALDGLLERFSAALIIKLHPIDKGKFTHDDLALGRHAYLLDDDDLFFADLQTHDVLNAFDVMVGDYSSILTDYLILDRPVVYAVEDVDVYGKNKGFVYNDISLYMPGDKVHTFRALLDALENAFVHPERHGGLRREFVRQKYSFTDDKSCERALKAIENWTPLTDYGELHFAEKTLYPVVQEYEKALDDLDERLWNSENRTREAVKILEGAIENNPAVAAALAALNAPPVSRIEAEENEKKARLEAICDHILKGYAGEYVFYSVRQNRDWTGKTRTMLQQLAAKIVDAGYLFLLGAVGAQSEKESVEEYPEAVSINERLVALHDCQYTELVLDCIRRHRKKAIFIIPSDFHDGNAALVELGVSKAHRVAYLYRYHIKDYRGKKNPSPYDVARWEALRCAAGNGHVRFVACTENLAELAAQEAGAHNIHAMTPGVDYEMFARADRIAIPERLRTLKTSGKPLVGYCGTLDGRLYYSIIHYICGRRKDCEFVFAGANRISGTWGHTFTDYPNIHLLEEADYGDAPAIIHAFDVAIIPYFKSARERVPAKLFEYFACGKPVVATDMTIARKYDGIFTGESHGDFVNALDAALDRKNDTDLRMRYAAIAEENDWGRKAREFLESMEL